VYESGSRFFLSRKPSESRRWLTPRVPKEQLYRLAPPRPARRRHVILESWDHGRLLIRAWWLWAVLAFLIWEFGIRWAALPVALIAYVFFLTQPKFHPAEYGLEFDFPADSPAFDATLAGLTGTPFTPGNQVTLLNNGDEFYPVMLEAIENARASVTMEQYIFWEGQVARRFAEALAEKARAGVAVKVLVDAIGSSTIGAETLRIFEAAGVQLAWFHPIRWYTLRRANHRTHRKSLVVDGSVGFTGGAGIADHWLGDAGGPAEWRDMMVRVDGPAAAALQTGFAQNWLVATGELLAGALYFPAAEPAGETAVQVIHSSPASGASAAATMHLLALKSAGRSLYIANPYFIPSRPMIEVLADAVRRGVDVKLLVAGVHNDTWWARHNSVRLYGRLLEAGVEICEYEPTMLHQKVMVVDGVWATIGTTNFDNRSFALNEETNLCFRDRALAGALQRVFLADLARARRVELAAWKRRGFAQRVQEWFAALIEDQV
jgi:cardiolipin synthase